MNAKETLNKVKTLLGLEVQLEERVLENGTRFEAEAFESGREVFIVTEDDERIAVPAGDYLLDDGMTLIVEEDGIIAEVQEVVEEEVEETVEAPVEEIVEASEEVELAPEDEAAVDDWAGMEKRIKNLEDAVADLKSRMGEKEDFNAEKVVEKEVELSAETEATPLKHNPEAEGETQFNLYSQNRPMNTQDRVFSKLFNN